MINSIHLFCFFFKNYFKAVLTVPVKSSVNWRNKHALDRCCKDLKGNSVGNSRWPGSIKCYSFKILFLVPCMPPQYVTYDIPGLSMLLAKWKPVPVHCRNGIIRGYRVRYQRMDGAFQVRIENTTADVLYAFLYDMDIYAKLQYWNKRVHTERRR